MQKHKVMIREPQFEDKDNFLQAMQHSQMLHHPWIKAPLTSEEFDEYLQRAHQPDQKRFLVCDHAQHIIGVFNISGIVRGLFQSAYLGFYVVEQYAGQGYMSQGLKLVLRYAFEDMKLHRLEANIQPDNARSIRLVKNNGFCYEGFSPRYLYINHEWRGHEHWVMTAEDYRVDTPAVLQQDCVSLVSYHSEWPRLAQEEMDNIKAVFPPSLLLDIQHVGSTAIPGLSAKPILDLQIAVAALDSMPWVAVPILQKLGYVYWASNPDPNRMFFVKGMPPYGEKRTHHVHIFEHHSDHWRHKLLFRDYLRSHSAIAKEYEQLKMKLAQHYQYDREMYTSEKSAFVHQVLQAAKKVT